MKRILQNIGIALLALFLWVFYKDCLNDIDDTDNYY